ncbi:hypothetical protein COCOR_06452 [Corallococcus coralloides DSM 2259]|uniref:Uncharacterized protein n=1 Tax=Corallococcus coralloides (strain ATCC 25202 / DSM 2259 / NBRC 100086 / M2) TaxID=1144275 RepID=H8MT05_CORCM|nr:hypothetical protein [Corallococcus coralloides]AFE06936.1 hypothetical protein COCOR_06452 [Corallococcus coralloides DSM 2259]
MTVSPSPDVQDAAPRNRRWRRVALWALVAVAVLEVALNVALNTGVTQAIMGRATDRTHLTWQRAWWLWPVGRLHLKGFTLTQQDSDVWWKVEVDALEAGMSLTGLLRKRVDVDGIDGHGARFHLEPSGAPEEPSNPNSKPWVIHLKDVTLHEVRELDFSRVRFAGSLDVTGTLNLQSRERLQVDLPSVRVAEGFIEVDGTRVARLESLDSRARLDAPFRAGKGYDLTQALGGQVKTRIDVLPLDWINDLLGASAPVSLRGGAGRVDLDVRMERNTLAPGSQLKASGEALDLRAGPMRAQAPWSLQASMDPEPKGQPSGSLRLAFEPVHMSGPKGYDLDIPEVALTVQARRREGQPGLELQPELLVAKSKPLDLRVLNPWLGQTLEIDSGHVTVRSEDPSKGKGTRARNALELRMDTDLISGRMGPNKVLLRAEVEVDARHLSWDMTELGLSGTTLRLRDVSSNGNVPIRAWSGNFTLPRASLSLSPTVLKARFASQLTDTQPIVALITSSKKLPGFLTSLLNIPKVEVTGQVQIDERGLQLRELKAKGESFSLEGHLDLVQGNITGALLASLGAVTGGIELRPGGKHDLHLLKATEWYKSQPVPPFR